MTLKKFLYLFWTTLLVGGASGLLIGVILEIQPITAAEKPLLDLLVGFIWFIGAGMLFSVVSQVGLFAFLMLNSFGKEVFKGWVWPAVQAVLLLFAIYDFAYLRQYLAGEKASIFIYFDLPLLLLAASLVVAWIKVKVTNGYAFIPTLFFMVIVTMIEWIPAVMGKSASGMLFMVFPLFMCNFWLIMQLHRLLKRSG